MDKELAAAQGLLAFVLLKVGEVELTKEEVQKGLPEGAGIYIDEVDGVIRVGVR